MKKYILLLSIVIFSCKKEFINQDLKKLNPISLTSDSTIIFNDSLSLPNNNTSEYQRVHDSIGTLLDIFFNSGITYDVGSYFVNTFDSLNGSIKIDIEQWNNGSKYLPFTALPEDGCGANGSYHASGIKSGGLLGSSFTAMFSVTNGTVGNFNLSLNGNYAGWSWNTTFTYINANGMSGQTYGVADYSFGTIFGTGHQYVFVLSWTVDARRCMVYYTWKKI